MRGVILGVIVVVALLWGAVIWRANQIARRDFGPNPCWFVQEAPAGDPQNLAPGPRGTYLPNPLRQINRRFIGIGVEDPQVRVPHFALAARNPDGQPALWGWSYLGWQFWSLQEADENAPSAFYDSFTDAQAILAACPDLPAAMQDATGAD